MVYISTIGTVADHLVLCEETSTQTKSYILVKHKSGHKAKQREMAWYHAKTQLVFYHRFYFQWNCHIHVHAVWLKHGKPRIGFCHLISIKEIFMQFPNAETTPVWKSTFLEQSHDQIKGLP